MKEASENRKAMLLQKWLSGDTSYQEEKQLRHWALDDPFFAEAMEGYEALPEADHSERLQQMKRKLQTKYRAEIKKKRFIVPLGLSAAAGIVLVLGAMIWLWLPPAQNAIVMENAPVENLSKSAPETDLATTSQAEEDIASDEPNEEIALDVEVSSESITSAPIARLSKPKTPPASKIQPPAASREEVVSYDETSKPQPAKEKETYENIEAADFAIAEPIPAPAESKDTPKTEVAGKEAANNSVSGYSVLDSAPSAASAADRKKTNPSDLRKITGHVYDESGEPLIGANVIVEGIQSGTLTDQDGRFQIAINKETAKLRINYIGYNSMLVPLSQEDSLSIVMNAQDVALEEVQIVGFKRSSKAKRLRPSRAESEEVEASPLVVEKEADLRPRGGFDKFEKYILQNLRYPEAAKANGIKGVVKLEFKIDPEGIPTDFKIISSLGFGCDQEAIRLLREGPKWKDKANQPGTTTNISISF